MEREFKWKANAKDFESILRYLNLSEIAPLEMRADYYDTSDRLLRARKIALRMRYEGDTRMCCLKLRDASNDGLHVHEEYECPAATLSEGLQALTAQGAPADLCSALRNTALDAVCQTKFLRRRAIWSDPMFTAELSFDFGVLGCAGHEITVSEIECEQKSGDDAAFEEACQLIAHRFSLKPEARSKLSRALDLERKQP